MTTDPLVVEAHRNKLIEPIPEGWPEGVGRSPLLPGYFSGIFVCMTIQNDEFFIYLIQKRFVETTCLHNPDSHIAIMQGKYSPHNHLRTFEKAGVRFWFETTSCQVSVRTKKRIRYLAYFETVSFYYDETIPIVYYDIPDNVISIINRQPPKNRYIPQRVKDEVWERDGGHCQNCGDFYEIEFDHIYPISRGGTSHADNLQLLCKPCNRKKRDKIYG